jgi:hypothetical protein
MHELAIFKLCVLREDGDRNSVEVLEILRSMVRSLNHAGIAFEILALPRAKLAVYQGEFEANGVTSLPALVDTQTGKCVAQGVPGITRWMQNSLKDQTTPDENYHDWVADKVGTADEVAREQASGRRGEDEDKFSGGLSEAQMSKAFDDFARERERVGLPDPRKAGRGLEENPDHRSESGSRRGRDEGTPRRVPARSAAQEEQDDINDAIAMSGVDKKEAAMLASMFGNMTS